MPRMPYPEVTLLPEHIRKILAGGPINVIRMVAGASPGVFDGFGQFSASFYGPSKLSPKLREIAILRVGYLSGSLYETYQHEALARHVGHGDAQIAAIKKGGSQPALNPIEQAVLDFTDDVVLNVRASDATLGNVKRHLSSQEIIDLILVIGLYMAISRLLETTGVELDAAPIDWKNAMPDQAAG
jgi:4-carboxymuconolactone decarboxylase